MGSLMCGLCVKDSAKAIGEAGISFSSSFICLPCIMSDTCGVLAKHGDSMPLTTEFHHINLTNALDFSSNSHFKASKCCTC